MSKGNRQRRRELGLLDAPVKCSARTSAGDPCKRSPIKGGNVCATHGGRDGVPTVRGGRCWHPATIRGLLQSAALDSSDAETDILAPNRKREAA